MALALAVASQPLGRDAAPGASSELPGLRLDIAVRFAGWPATRQRVSSAWVTTRRMVDLRVRLLAKHRRERIGPRQG